jgi:hypothetical protein
MKHRDGRLLPRKIELKGKLCISNVTTCIVRIYLVCLCMCKYKYLFRYVILKSTWMYNILFSYKIFSSTCFGCVPTPVPAPWNKHTKTESTQIQHKLSTKRPHQNHAIPKQTLRHTPKYKYHTKF